MNIFILDDKPAKAAEFHCDKHVVKMILEAGQMLCTAHWISWLGVQGKTRSDFRLVRDMKSYLMENMPEKLQPPWKLTHVNHPCNVWTRASLDNYNWHLHLMGCLLIEYKKRYKKIHKSTKVFDWLVTHTPVNLKSAGLQPFPICMKDEYKISDNPVECYREYYVKDKVRFARWLYSETPSWWIQYFKPAREKLKNSVLQYIVEVVEPTRDELSGLPACPFVKKERIANKLLVDTFDQNTENFLQKIKQLKNSEFTDAVFAQFREKTLTSQQSRKYQGFLNKVLKKTFDEYWAIVVNPNTEYSIKGFNPRKHAPCLLILITEKSKLNDAHNKILKTDYFYNFSKPYLDFLSVDVKEISHHTRANN